MLCIDVADIEFSEIVKKKNQDGQTKKVIFMNSHLSFRVQDINEEGSKTYSIPSLMIENADYDVNQGK
jgi:hypothetical protein